MKKGFLDWTSEGINLFIFEREGDDYVCSDTVEITSGASPDSESLAPVSGSGIREPVLSLPLEDLTLREIHFPFSDRDKIRDTLRYELEGSLLGSASDYVIDHVVIGSDSNSSSVLAVCIEKQILSKIMRILSSAGIEPRAVTSLDLAITGPGERLISGDIVSEPEQRAAAAAREISSSTINLRQEEFAFTGDIERFKKAVRLSSILAAALVIIIAVHFGIQYYAGLKNEDALSRSLLQSYRSVFPSDKKVTDPERQFLSRLREAESKMDTLAGIAALDILMNISSPVKGNVTLRELNAEKHSVLIKGSAGSFEDIDAMKNSLTGRFGEVKVLESSAAADGRVSFSMLMKEAPLEY